MRRQWLRRLWPLTLLLCAPVGAFEFEMGAVSLQDTFVVPVWTTVSFQQSFNAPPLVFALPTNEGSDPATIRIRNVTTSGFEILQVEPNANDGPHVAMNTAYLAIEAGNHLLPDGSRVLAFEHVTASFANRLISNTWDSLTFPGAFTGTPAVLGSIQTVNNESQTPPSTSSVPFMDVGIRNVTSGGMQVTLERMESTAGAVTALERIGFLVIQNLVDFSFVDAFGNSVVLKSLATPRNIRGWDDGCYTNNYGTPFAGTPLAIASANSRFGNNGGWVRRCGQSATGLSLTVDEDIDADSERNHTTESAGIVAASVAFHANFNVDLAIAKTFTTISDPVNGTSDPKAIPTATIGYAIDVENTGSLSPDADSLVFTDEINSNLSLCVDTSCQSGGAVVLDTTGSPVPPGVSIGTVEYSDNGGASYSYVPIPDADGYDGDVDAVRITLAGTLATISASGAPSFQLRLAARVD